VVRGWEAEYDQNWRHSNKILDDSIERECDVARKEVE
jgi:hypothetical protein